MSPVETARLGKYKRTALFQCKKGISCPGTKINSLEEEEYVDIIFMDLNTLLVVVITYHYQFDCRTLVSPLTMCSPY
jgi:hypothetical protein